MLSFVVAWKLSDFEDLWRGFLGPSWFQPWLSERLYFFRQQRWEVLQSASEVLVAPAWAVIVGIPISMLGNFRSMSLWSE